MSASNAPTLALTLARLAVERGDHCAVSWPTGSRTYAELGADVSRIADTLSRHGLRRGDRIAVLARNGLPYVQLVYAASWSGVALVCLNWRLEVAEIQAVLRDSDPALVFAEQDFADLLDEDRPVVWLDGGAAATPGFAGWYAAGDASTQPDPGQGDESVALLLYTTGTTGEPKGGQMVERMFRHMAQQATVAWRMHAEMKFMACLPLFHVSGMSSVMCCVHQGGEVVIPGGTSVADIAGAVEARGVTHTTLVPTVLTSLVAEKAADTYDLSSLEVIVYGSAPSGSSLIDEAMRMLPDTGFSQGYGLTETCAGVAIAPIYTLDDVNPHPGSVGTILPNCECRIVDPVTAQDVPDGEDGEIWLRTPQLTPGYLNKPEQTSSAISPEGWFRTGDVGCLDEAGFLYIRDRLKDVIISGGENIYSVEVENAISSHPAVLETAVVGVPHTHWGETVKAVVVRRPGHTLDEDELRSWLDGRLARYKRPRIVQFVQVLPKTGSGKILKRSLRDRKPGDMPEQPSPDPVEVAPVRPGEELDWTALQAYLRSHLDVDGEFSVVQFPHGSANLTYRLALGQQRLVLRRPPFGAVAAGGHDMGREFRALSRLWRAYPRAPRALHHCTDQAVIGSEFIVVEYRPGIVVWGAIPTSMASVEDAGRRIGLATLDALSDLHLVDYEAIGMADLGRPEGFLQRQLDGWMKRWEAVAPEVDDDPVHALGMALTRRRPEPQRSAVLHNDFKIDNCQFQPGDPDRVTAVFDWDMATLGDPLADLGTLLNYWPADAGEQGAEVLAVPGLENLGLPSKREIVARYADRTGLDVGQVAWYEALGCWRTSIIMQQLYARWLRGETTDERMASRGAQVFPLAERGLRILERLS